MLRHISSPLRLYVGCGCLSGLAPELTRAGCRNAVLLTKPGSAVLDTDTRLSLFDPKTRPRAIFLDDVCLDSAPPDVTCRAAANTLASAVEGLMAAEDPIAEGMLLQSLRLLGPGAGRRDLALAALLCAQGTDHTGLGLATGLSHALSVICGVDGGTAKAIVLPHVLPLVPAAGRARLAGLWACEDAALPSRLAEALATFEPARRLREVGVAAADLPAVAGACGDDWFVRSAAISPERIEAVLRAAW